MNPSAVIDNSSLVYLSHLHESNYIFNYLTNLFRTIYIPAQVVLEYQEGLIKEPHRGRILNRLNPDRGFFRFCNRYDSIVLAMIRDYKGIDKGEADTYAQLRKVNAHFIISDDKPFIKAMLKLDKTTRIYSKLHLLC